MEDFTLTFTPQERELLKKAVQHMAELHEPGSDQFRGISAIKDQYKALAEKLSASESNTGE